MKRDFKQKGMWTFFRHELDYTKEEWRIIENSKHSSDTFHTLEGIQRQLNEIKTIGFILYTQVVDGEIVMHKTAVESVIVIGKD